LDALARLLLDVLVICRTDAIVQWLLDALARWLSNAPAVEYASTVGIWQLESASVGVFGKTWM